MTVSHNLQRINVALSAAVVFLTPLFFVPLTSEFYEYNKMILLFIFACISLLLWTARFVVDRQVRLTRTPLGLPLLLLAFTWIASTWFNSPNRWDALFEPSQTGTILALVVLFFTTINAVGHKKHVETLALSFMLSVGILGVLTVLFASGLLSSIVPVAYMKSPLWTPTGNPLGTLVTLLTGLVFSGIIVFKTRFNPAKNNNIITVFTLVTAFIGSALLLYRLFGSSDVNNRPVFLSQSASWSIALESLKASPLLGTGPSTYLSDFTRFRPVSFNNEVTWAVRFASSSNYYLQLMSTVGLVGFLLYFAVAARMVQLTWKAFATNTDSSLHSLAIAASVTATLVILSQIFVPVSLVTLTVTFFLMALTISAFKHLGSSMVHEANIDIVAASESGLRTPVLPVVSVVLAAALLAATGFYSIKTYMAELYFQKALSFAAANDGKSTYDALIQAYTTNPVKDTYRVAYAQTNLLLANSLAAKKDLTDQDKSNISALIQQSIREAKNAVALNPVKVTNVENLASTYQAVIPLAKGADAWTVAAYQAAIQLDPINPSLRVALGSVLFQLKQYDDAIQLFQQAANLKPDLANAYYNLAAAYREKGDYTRAAAAMQATLNNVKRDSADYTKAAAELDELKKKLNEKTTSQTPEVNAPAQTNLEAPKPLPTARITPITVPAELAPETSPTPGATKAPAAPTASPTPVKP